MKTTLYFVRHAQSDSSVRDTKTRPLTEKGRKDAERLSDYFRETPITRIFSSPYTRAIDTVKPLSKARNLPITTDDRVREWMGGRPFPHEIFRQRMQEMFEDEQSTNGGAESMKRLKKRAQEFILHLLSRYPGESILIGTHALWLTAAVKNYENTIGLDFLMNLLPVAPFAAVMTFEDFSCVSMRFQNPLEEEILSKDARSAGKSNLHTFLTNRIPSENK